MRHFPLLLPSPVTTTNTTTSTTFVTVTTTTTPTATTTNHNRNIHNQDKKRTTKPEKKSESKRRKKRRKSLRKKEKLNENKIQIIIKRLYITTSNNKNRISSYTTLQNSYYLLPTFIKLKRRLIFIHLPTIKTIKTCLFSIRLFVSPFLSLYCVFFLVS